MIAITGATGFIGSHLVRRLTEINRPVKTLARIPPQNDLAPSKRLNRVVGDIRDSSARQRLLTHCSVLVHLANVYQNRVSGIAEMIAVNETASIRLLSEAARTGVRRIVYLSTAGVHTHTGGIADESTPLRLHSKDPYERQKILSLIHI